MVHLATCSDFTRIPDHHDDGYRVSSLSSINRGVFVGRPHLKDEVPPTSCARLCNWLAHFDHYWVQLVGRSRIDPSGCHTISVDCSHRRLGKSDRQQLPCHKGWCSSMDLAANRQRSVGGNDLGGISIRGVLPAAIPGKRPDMGSFWSDRDFRHPDVE